MSTQICTVTKYIITEKYGISADLFVKDKQYYVTFEYDGTIVHLQLCKVTELSSEFIEDIAGWHVDDFVMKKRLELF